MKHRYRIPTFASLVLVASLFVTTGLAQAAPQEITITPTSNSPIINPGSTYNNSFQMLNQGQSAYAFQVYASPYHVSGEDYTPDFTALPGVVSVDKWFTLASAGGYVNPGQAATINYSISVPAGTPPGGYYAAVFAQTQYPKTANSITLNERVGEIFYIQVAGAVTQKGEILTWESSLLQKPPLAANLRLSDSGGLHYPATIRVNVRDIFGHSKYGLYTVKEVLPQTTRRIPITWSKAPSIGLFKVTGNVSFLGQGHTLPTKWVLVMSSSVRIGLLVILGLIVLFVLVRLVYRRKSKKASRK